MIFPITRKIRIIIVRLWRNLLMGVVSFVSVAGPKASRIQQFVLKICGVQVAGDVYFGRGVMLLAPERLTLGRRASIGDSAHIASHAPITIGDDFLAAPGLYLNSGQHDPVTLRGFGEEIVIGHRVWCGARVTICAGVVIGNDVVIGAGAVVIESIPSDCIAVGVPARVVKVLQRGQGTVEGMFSAVRCPEAEQG